MAKYAITHSCGHSETVQLYGKHTDRSRYMDNAERRQCRDCYNASLVAKTADMGLPALTGSDKQVAWAETIRAKALLNAAESLDDVGAEVMAIVRAKETARYWIDRRDMFARQTWLAEAVRKRINQRG